MNPELTCVYKIKGRWESRGMGWDRKGYNPGKHTYCLAPEFSTNTHIPAVESPEYIWYRDVSPSQPKAKLQLQAILRPKKINLSSTICQF
jgi:hypothetical protein